MDSYMFKTMIFSKNSLKIKFKSFTCVFLQFDLPVYIACNFDEVFPHKHNSVLHIKTT